MSSKYLSRMWPHREDGPPPKRISTPAGIRLSVIMDKKELSVQSPRSPRPPHLMLPNPVHGVVVTREVDVQSTKKSTERTRNPSPSPPYSQSIFSEKSVLAEERATRRRPAAQLFVRRRLFIILGVAVTVLLALIIGLAAGLSKKHANAIKSSSGGSSTSPTSPAQTIVTTSVPLPSNFPLGTYSVATYLDRILTDCAGDPGAWTCPPNVVHETDPTASLEVFNFAITAGSSPGTYQLAPTGLLSAAGATGNTFAAAAPLTVLDKGQASERYHFSTTLTKSGPATLNGSSTADTCVFPATTFQGWLYTRAARNYPAAGQTLPPGAALGPLWPFEARVEFDVGGYVGGSVQPLCYAGGATSGAGIAPGAPQDAGNLCSCVYRNSNVGS